MTAHTPGPWVACPGNARQHYRIECKGAHNDLDWIAQLKGPDREANAEFIVRACNAHEELLAACRATMKAIPTHYVRPGRVAVDCDCSMCETRPRVAAAIANAEGPKSR